MWNVTTSSWSTDIGFVEKERLEYMQEVGYASGKTGKDTDSALETLTTAFVSPYWEIKRGHFEIPLSAALFTKNMGQASSLVGPAVASGALLQWQFERTHFFELKAIANWSRTYSVMRSEKPYAIDTGFERSSTTPWTLLQGRVSLLDRHVLSATDLFDIKVNQEQVSGTHANSALNISRTLTSAEGIFTKKISDKHTFGLGGIFQTWNKKNFAENTNSQQGALAQFEAQDAYTVSQKNFATLKLAVLPLRNPTTLSPIEVSGEWKYLLTHHWKTVTTLERTNDILNMEGSHALRTRGQFSTTWRDFSRFDFGVNSSLSTSEIQLSKVTKKTVTQWAIEPNARAYWDHEISFGARMSLTGTQDHGVPDGNSSRVGIWINTSWPSTPEKKDL